MHAPRSIPEIKDERNSAEEAQMRDSPEGGELNPAVDDRRYCKKVVSFRFILNR